MANTIKASINKTNSIRKSSRRNSHLTDIIIITYVVAYISYQSATVDFFTLLSVLVHTLYQFVGKYLQFPILTLYMALLQVMVQKEEFLTISLQYC